MLVTTRFVVLVVSVPLGLASTVLTFATLAKGGEDEATNSTVSDC